MRRNKFPLNPTSQPLWPPLFDPEHARIAIATHHINSHGQQRQRDKKMQVDRFADGEVNVMVKENVRGKDVYIIQPTCMPVNENLVELLLMVRERERLGGATTRDLNSTWHSSNNCRQAVHTYLCGPVVRGICIVFVDAHGLHLMLPVLTRALLPYSWHKLDI